MSERAELFELVKPGLMRGQRISLEIADADIDPFAASRLGAGEWLARTIDANNKQSAVRPPIAGTNSGHPDIDVVDAAVLNPIIVKSTRTDTQSVLRLTLLQDKGAVIHSGEHLRGTAAVADISTGVTAVTASGGAGNNDTLTQSGATFIDDGVLPGDTLNITDGLGDGDNGTFIVVAVVSQTVLEVAEGTFVGDTVVIFDVDGVRGLTYKVGQALHVTLYQDVDDPTVVRSGLAAPAAALAVQPVSTTATATFAWPTGAEDGTTPGLVIEQGPVVAKVLRPPFQRSGTGRGGRFDVIEALLN